MNSFVNFKTFHDINLSQQGTGSAIFLTGSKHTSDTPQTHHKHITGTPQAQLRHTTDTPQNTPQTHHRHTTDTLQTHHRHATDRPLLFLWFTCVLRWCFSESSVLCESGSEYSQMAPKWLPRSTQNGSPGSQMAPRIHSKWVPGGPPATSKARFRKKVPYPPLNVPPRGSKKTPKMDTQITKNRSQMNFSHD